MKKDASRFSPKGVLFHRTFFTAPTFFIQRPREGAVRPVDARFAPTGAKRRQNLSKPDGLRIKKADGA